MPESVKTERWAKITIFGKGMEMTKAFRPTERFFIPFFSFFPKNERRKEGKRTFPARTALFLGKIHPQHAPNYKANA
jgi:hypothetical protein